MTDTFLDRAYMASGNAEMRALYDDWASEYDGEVARNGYLTPQRTADILPAHITDRGAPVLDFGCGTGLSGEALAAAGFSAIDGADLSPAMLDIAREKGCYRNLFEIDASGPLPKRIGNYPTIAAVGVISRGAAPPSVFADIIALMQPGAVLAFSMNDLSRDDPAYGDLVKQSVAVGEVELLAEQHGPHLAKYGANSGSTIYVLRRMG